MPERRPQDYQITVLLNRWMGGDADAANVVLELVYTRLHQMAAARLRAQRYRLSLQTTELVNEFYVRFNNSPQMPFANRDHFFAIAAFTLRRVLIDILRHRHAAKRGGGDIVLSLDAAERLLPAALFPDYLEIDEALEALEQLDPRVVRVIEMRFFADMTEEEIAKALRVSTKTIKRDWQWGRAWLTSYLDQKRSKQRLTDEPPR